MTKQVRDWQKDMESCEGVERGEWSIHDLMVEQSQISTYWLQQYAAAEAREKKLREAIEKAIKEKSQWGDTGNALDVVTRYLSDTLATIYPKEEQAKKYTFKVILHIYNGIRTTVNGEQVTIESHSAEQAERKLRESIESQYKRSTHLLLSSLQLELVKEEET